MTQEKEIDVFEKINLDSQKFENQRHFVLSSIKDFVATDNIIARVHRLADWVMDNPNHEILSASGEGIVSIGLNKSVSRARIARVINSNGYRQVKKDCDLDKIKERYASTSYFNLDSDLSERHRMVFVSRFTGQDADCLIVVHRHPDSIQINQYASKNIVAALKYIRESS